MRPIEIGRTPLGTPVLAGAAQGFLCLVQGATGSGKSVLASNVTLELAKAMGPSFQAAVIDPKRVSFAWAKPRFYVYTEETDWPRLLEALSSEMDRRYEYMASHGFVDCPISPDRPYILLVIEEMSAVTNSQRLLKRERDRIASLLIDYANRCRQCSMGLLIVCQSCDSTTMPTVVRSNCSTRFAMRTYGEEQVRMIAAGREEECPCDLLTLPGQFYALTSETHGRWVKGRARNTSAEELGRVARTLAADKRTPYCLDWDSPDYLG